MVEVASIYYLTPAIVAIRSSTHPSATIYTMETCMCVCLWIIVCMNVIQTGTSLWDPERDPDCEFSDPCSISTKIWTMYILNKN